MKRRVIVQPIPRAGQRRLYQYWQEHTGCTIVTADAERVPHRLVAFGGRKAFALIANLIRQLAKCSWDGSAEAPTSKRLGKSDILKFPDCQRKNPVNSWKKILLLARIVYI
jgi:hypothetical protein